MTIFIQDIKGQVQQQEEFFRARFGDKWNTTTAISVLDLDFKHEIFPQPTSSFGQFRMMESRQDHNSASIFIFLTIITSMPQCK